MTPIHKLLNRLRWDPEFARGEFEVGYFDRVAKQVIRVPLRELEFPAETPGAFRCVDAEGRPHRVPFHRVREIFKNGRPLWRRPGRNGGGD
jgi:uncharacterized protein (UPF0248 family)